MAMAVIESPGMPNTSAGIQAPASELLLAAPDSTMPSTWPVPNFSGSLEKRLLIAYDIHAAMSAPAPGWMPTAVPSALPRRRFQRYFLVSVHMPVKTLPSLSFRMRPGGFRSTMKRRISDTANMPTIIGISSTPESRSVTPKVKRGCAGRVLQADAGDEQAEQQRDQRLQRSTRSR